MLATTRFREDVLARLDDLMRPSGFPRRRRSQVFVKETSPRLSCWMHLNFGLYEKAGQYIINPSVGVTYSAIEADLVACGARRKASSVEAGTFGMMLQSLSGHGYEGPVADSPSTVAQRIVDDWTHAGLPAVARMSALPSVIEMLKSEVPGDWCCPSRSDRGRLLPLALLHSGARDEALQALGRMEEDLRGRDQMIPSFADFRRWFEGRAR